MRARRRRWYQAEEQRSSDTSQRMADHTKKTRELARKINGVIREVDERLERNAEEFVERYASGDRRTAMRVDDRNYLTELIRENRYPLIRLQVDYSHLYLSELAGLEGEFGRVTTHAHAEIVADDRFRELREVQPDFLVLKSNSGSVLQIVVIIVFLASQLGPGAAQSVNSDIVAAYIKDLFDRFRAVIRLPGQSRPANPISEYVKKIEDHANYRHVEMTHEEYESKVGRRVLSTLKIKGAKRTNRKLVFIGDLGSNLLHSEECPAVQTIDVGERLEFDNITDDLAKRLRPHRTCLRTRKAAESGKKKRTVRKRSRVRGGSR